MSHESLPIVRSVRRIGSNSSTNLKVDGYMDSTKTSTSSGLLNSSSTITENLMEWHYEHHSRKFFKHELERQDRFLAL